MENKVFGEPLVKKGLNKIEVAGFGLYTAMFGIILFLSNLTDISWFLVAGSWLVGLSFFAFIVCLTSNNSLLKLNKEYSYSKTYIISSILFVIYLVSFFVMY